MRKIIMLDYFLLFLLVVLLSAVREGKLEKNKQEILSSVDSTLEIYKQSQQLKDHVQNDKTKHLANRYYEIPLNEAEQKDVDERKKILESILIKVKSIARSSENKTASAILGLLSDGSAICIAEPLGLRFVEREELVDSGVGIVVFKGNEKILFPQWRKVRNNLQAGIMYDKEYNCIIIVEDSLHSKQFKAVRLLHEGQKALSPQNIQKDEFKLYEFENDVWRGLYGTHYSVLVEQEADWIKKTIDSENKKVGDYYPLGTRFADSLTMYMGEPVSSKEREDREFRFRIYATFDMLDRYYTAKDRDQKKMLFLKNLAKQ